MATEQLIAEMLSAIKRQGDTLTALVQNQQVANNVAANNTNTIVSHNIMIESFDPEEEDFSSYKERLENFINLRGVNENDDKTKRNLLLGCLKRVQFQQLAAITAPERPGDKSYDELVKLLTQRFDKITSVHTERHKFLSRIQGKTETIANYVSGLKELAQKCNWVCPKEDCKTVIDTIFQAQFIRGLREANVREKMLSMGETTLEKTIQTALNIEAAHKQTREEYAGTGTSNVNKITQRQARSKSRGDRTALTPHTSKSRNTSKSPNRKSRNNLSNIGLNGLCLHCGYNNHTSQECSVKHKLFCKACKKKGHIEKVCITTRKNTSNVRQTTTDDNTYDDEERNSINKITEVTIFEIKNEEHFARKFNVKVRLQNKTQTFELDTGSPVTILSQHDYNKLNLRATVTECTNIRFRAYNEELIIPIGYVEIPVTYKRFTTHLTLYIVKRNFTPILGRVWFRKLKIIHLPITSEHDGDENGIRQIDITGKYRQIFENRVGKMPNVKFKLELKEDATPVFLPPRTVPFALHRKVEEEIAKLEQENIIEKVEFSQWGTPLVVVPKANGEIRICADYKNTVNKHLKETHYPIPKIDEIINSTHGSEYFCVLDLHKAYLHIELDEESQLVAAISTHLPNKYLVDYQT
ncbi:uncharacterized protein K02A2.6-like [Chrysoperla carnea]|uniref:uncharacterized protein K02A2.6-like n=1 Tax=Chrysoperla carnea TaxID=189513 RepID=UPI001D092196|nr:uncharacterized protein K02A2.6-like [Chrysoperla carnea]